MGYWEEKFRNYFQSRANKLYARSILMTLFGHYTTDKEVKDKFSDIESYLNSFFDFIEYLYFRKRLYQTGLFPTLVTVEKGVNFYLKGEKELDREEAFQMIYLLLTGVFISKNKVIVNLLSSNEEGWRRFVDLLRREEAAVVKDDQNGGITGIDYNFIYKFLGVKEFPIDYPNIFVFSFINFFVRWWFKEKNRVKVSDIFELSKEIENKGLDDSTVLVYIQVPKKAGRRVYFFSKVNRFLTQWYGKYLLSGDEKDIFLPRFLSNFVIYDKKYKDKILTSLDKFIYYLLNGKINGELLDKLINFKLSFELSSKGKHDLVISAAKFYENIR